MIFSLVMQSRDGRERAFAVNKPSVVIGRETTCDLRVPIPSVSQKHCQIVVEGEHLRLVDLRSEQGTYHNGARVEQADLQAEDVVTVGPVTFIVRQLAASEVSGTSANGVAGPNGHAAHAPGGEVVIERVMPRHPAGNDNTEPLVEG